MGKHYANMRKLVQDVNGSFVDALAQYREDRTMGAYLCDSRVEAGFNPSFYS